MKAGMDREAASVHRQRINALREERDRIEESLLQPQRLLRGSLIEKYELAGGLKRTNSAYYLSVPVQGGRRRFHYVSKKVLEQARRENEAYRNYKQSLSHLRSLEREIHREFTALRRGLEVSPP
jgi:hypothetical protein